MNFPATAHTWRQIATGASVILVVALALLIGCRRDNGVPPGVAVAQKKEEDKGPPFFKEMTADSGVAFTYRNGEEAGHLAILESLGGGILLIDFNNDGLLDLFLPGGGYYDGPDKKQIRGHPCKLYQNLGGWKFKEVTKDVGLDIPWFYTHGGAVGDYDRDGWPDLLVTGWGRVALLHNESDGKAGRRFVDVTQKAGLTDALWSTSAAWGDFDGDGFADLYICHYADWSFAEGHNPKCTYDGQTPDVCPPKTFTALPHILYRNNGNGTFTDVSKSAGLRVPRKEQDYAMLSGLNDDTRSALKRADTDKEFGKGLGVLVVDVNGDGRPDVYVANDTVDNFLYINRGARGQILFEEVGLGAGVARDDHGSPNGSMGLDAGDYLGNGRPSIWVTNYENEMHALYLNDCIQDRIIFRYATQMSGIAALGQAFVGWGTHFVDLDLDGLLDLVVVNGHAIRFPKGKAKRAQYPVLMHNEGKGRFKEISRRGGPYFEAVHVGRGAAFGDLDNDGRVDVVISNINEPVVLLRNVGGEGQHWLGVTLAAKGNPDLTGARLVLVAGGQTQSRFAKGGGSYASANDQRHVFGIGTNDRIDKLTVVWPSGKEQSWTDLKIDRYWKLTEGEAQAQPPGSGKRP